MVVHLASACPQWANLEQNVQLGYFHFGWSENQSAEIAIVKKCRFEILIENVNPLFVLDFTKDFFIYIACTIFLQISLLYAMKTCSKDLSAMNKPSAF